MLSTPGGSPASSPRRMTASAVSGVCSAGLRTIVQPAPSAGAALRVGIAAGKFHGVMPGADADGLLGHDDAPVAHVGRDGVAVDALGLLAEPLQEARRVGDLDARLGQRLALLGGQQRREVLLVLDHEVGPAAHDHRALLGQQPAPARQRALRGLDRAPRLGRAHAGHVGHDLARGGVDDGEGGAGVGVDPAAVDVSLTQDEVAVSALTIRGRS